MTTHADDSLRRLNRYRWALQKDLLKSLSFNAAHYLIVRFLITSEGFGTGDS